MPKLLFALFLALCVSTLGLGQTTQRASAEDAMESLMIERMAVIEELHCIEFDDNWKPRVSFGFPDDLSMSERSDWDGCYLPETQSFLFAPMHRYGKEISLLDHELGHALMDQVSRRSANRPWPDYECVIYMTIKEKVSVKIRSEGVGTYFEYKGQPPYKDDDQYGFNWLPSGPEDLAWDNIHYSYMGGRWIVAPIIKQYGEQGLVYIITHPIEYHYDNLREGAKAYREKALKELATTTTPP
ncbi:MAG: hypothetical protein IT410_04095 [Candidatus Doudnabacteria bacterium]|nr:hypothetical protein [Candidatus Doudnabacteria bacterium]